LPIISINLTIGKGLVTDFSSSRTGLARELPELPPAGVPPVFVPGKRLQQGIPQTQGEVDSFSQDLALLHRKSLIHCGIPGQVSCVNEEDPNLVVQESFGLVGIPFHQPTDITDPETH